MNPFDTALQKKLHTWEEKGLLRTLKNQNHSLIDFTSNDYLGLARSPELFKQIETKVHELVNKLNGATGSRLLSGNSLFMEETEHKLSGIFKSESTLLFNSGYTANLAVLSSLPQRNDTIIYDELVHACMKDGARLSMSKRLSFKHNDLNDLESKIKKASGRIFIAVESIYSMDGDQCPLKDLVALSERYDATVILDEAHSTGVLGQQGSGLAVSLGLSDKIGVRIYTFGKAMGIHGACVAGSKLLQHYLINCARPFIYTTALPPHSLVAINCAFDYLIKNIQLQFTLKQKIDVYKSGASDLKNQTITESSIQTVIVPGNTNAKRAAAKLQQEGFDIRAILSPTVPVGLERLRICLHTFNEDEQIIRLTKELKLLSNKKTAV